MLYKTLSAAVFGIDASIIEVEVDVSGIKTMEDTRFLPPTSPSTLPRRTFAKRAPASTYPWLWES
jgi:hypothetical protein